MKKILITLAMIACSSSVMAQTLASPGAGTPGGMTANRIACNPTNHMVGATFGMIILTQALAPEYNVRGGFFTKTGVYPGALTSQYAMSVVRQDEYSAELVVPDMGLKVILSKYAFKADVFNAGQSLPAYTCGY